MTQSKMVKNFNPEGELTPEKMTKNVEDYIVELFEELPLESKKKVIAEMFEIMRPEKPQSRMDKSYYTY